MNAKIFSILSLFFVIVNGTNGQITLEFSDYHKFDNKYYRGFMIQDLNTIELSASGPEQFWDYFLLDDQSNDTLSILKVDETPYAEYFPQAEIALTSNFEKFYYESLEPEGVKIMGLSIINPIDSSVEIIPYEFEGIAIPFPLNYLDSYTFNYAFNQYLSPQNGIIPGSDDSTWIRSRVSIDIDVDAHGMLTIPAGTFDALRLKQVSEKTDSVFIYNELQEWEYFNIYTETSNTYLFYTKNIGASLLTITEREDQITALSFLKGFIIDHITDPEQKIIKVYPVPAQDRLNLEVLYNGPYRIYSIDNKFIASGEFIKGQNMLDISKLNNGVYLLQSSNNEGISNQNVRFIVAR
jgi:hypothetical protein